MDTDKKAALRRRLAENRMRIERSRKEDIKRQIMQEVEGFCGRYRFADDDETARITGFMGRLKFSFPGHISCEEDVHVCDELMDEEVYLVFLGGSEAQLGIYVCGICRDFLSDMDSWEVFSPYLLLICRDMERYIYIDDMRRLTGSRI